MNATSKRATTGATVLIALLLTLSCLAITALANTLQAYAAETGQTVYATLYQKNGEYTLVIQEKSTPVSTYGTKVDSSTVVLSDDFEVEHLFTWSEHRPWAHDGKGPFEDKYPQHIAFSGSIKAPKSLDGFLSGMDETRSIDLRGLDTSQTTCMGSLFHSCYKLETIDLSPLKTSSVTDTSLMFYNCEALKSIDLSPLDTSKVTTMRGMFCGCDALKSIDLSPLDTSNVTNMSDMFGKCTEDGDIWGSGLTSIDLSSLDTSNVTNMSDMFAGCANLKTIDLSPLDTSNVTNMSDMFAGCTSLETIDLSLDTSKATKMHTMFLHCTSLSAIALRPGCKMVDSALSPFWMHETAAIEPEDPTVVSSIKEPCQYEYFIAKSSYTITALREGTTWLKISSTDQLSNTVYLDVTVKQPSESWGPAIVPSQSITPDPSPAPIKSSLAKASVSVKERPFTGKTLTPTSVTVKLGGKTLKKGTDYTVSCKGGKAVGSYKVTIVGKGSYTGTKTATFQVVPKAVSGAKAKGTKKSLKVTWKKPSKAARAQVTGYQVRYSTAKSMKGAKTVKVKGSSKTSATVKKLKGGKKYYVQVRAYKTVKGKTYYSAWSAVKSVKTRK